KTKTDSVATKTDIENSKSVFVSGRRGKSAEKGNRPSSVAVMPDTTAPLRRLWKEIYVTASAVSEK
ncbi:MAG: hypothetical protein II484_03790, partial [Bacteroidaceae bacterium]|nr:hypothetical protein [Bacteroidaceae bacterium]